MEQRIGWLVKNVGVRKYKTIMRIYNTVLKIECNHGCGGYVYYEKGIGKIGRYCETYPTWNYCDKCFARQEKKVVDRKNKWKKEHSYTQDRKQKSKV